MRIIIILYCVWLASAGTVPEKCDGVTFNGKYYDKEVLTNIEDADGFSLDKNTNTLFFSYSYPEYRTNAKGTHSVIGIGYYNMDTKEFHDVLEVTGGLTTEIDQKTGDVYFGGSDGIYKFDSSNKTAELYAAEGENIYFLYYDKALYYTTYPDYKIYSYDGKEIKKVSDIKVKRFIGNLEKYYFCNSTGLYRLLDDKEENAEIFSNSSEVFKVFTKDSNGNIFVTGENCVYVPNEEKRKLDKIADIEGIRGLVFDKNKNIIYSDDNSIYRLTPSKAKCPPDSHL